MNTVRIVYLVNRDHHFIDVNGERALDGELLPYGEPEHIEQICIALGCKVSQEIMWDDVPECSQEKRVLLQAAEIKLVTAEHVESEDLHNIYVDDVQVMSEEYIRDLDSFESLVKALGAQIEYRTVEDSDGSS